MTIDKYNSSHKNWTNIFHRISNAIDTNLLRNPDTYKICVMFWIYLVVSIVLCIIEKIKKQVQEKLFFKHSSGETMNTWEYFCSFVALFNFLYSVHYTVEDYPFRLSSSFTEALIWVRIARIKVSYLSWAANE